MIRRLIKSAVRHTVLMGLKTIVKVTNNSKPKVSQEATELNHSMLLFHPSRDLANEVEFPPNLTIANPFPGTRNVGYSDVWNMVDEDVVERLLTEGFIKVRKLEDGSWVGLIRLATTMSLCSDITPTTMYGYRWCFRNEEEANHFFYTIKEFDEIPTVASSLVGHRYRDFARMQVTDKIGLRKW